MGTAFQKLREWLTIDEAAGELSHAFSHKVSAADVLRLGLDGHLPLSLYLPAPVPARCGPKNGETSDGREVSRSISGLCGLPMTGRAKLQVEHDYHWLERRAWVPIDGPIGASVEREGLVCKLSPDPGEAGFSPRPQSEFPLGSVVVIRRIHLNDFVKVHEQSAPSTKQDVGDKALGERERTTLLIIIAALCRRLKFSPEARGTAGDIAQLTAQIGASVTDDTVRTVLAKVTQAVESRQK